MRALCRLLLVLVLPVLSARAAVQPEFVAAFRDASGAYAMTALGDVYSIGNNAPRKLFTLSDIGGRPFGWRRLPASFVRFRSEWLVCDNTTRLLHFNERGKFVRGTEGPVNIATMAVAGDQLIIHNLIAGSPAEQLCVSRDAANVTPVPHPDTRRFESPLENLLIIVGSGRGEVFASPVIGPPVVRVLWPANSRRQISTQYSRTAFRAGLDQPVGIVDDIGPYSQPVRDLYPLQDGRIVVLRNREDIRSAAGKQETIAGRRADRYSSAGKHEATAEFPSTMRWVTAVTDGTVTAVTKTGEMATVRWGTPQPGQVVK